MEQYLFDLKIAALLLGVEEDSLEAVEFLRQYRDKITQLVRNFTHDFFIAKGWSESKIEEELKKLQEEHIENSEFIEDFEYLDGLGRVQNEYNKKIYDLYRPQVSQMQKDKINAYIKEIQGLTNKSLGE